MTENNDSKIVVKTLGLNKTFYMGDMAVEVLKDINIEIAKGEFVSIMGPSGSGKSTLLYLLGGLDQPTSGSITIEGIELSTMKDAQQSIMRRRQVGFVFQFYNLIPNLTVEENTLLPALLDGKKIKDYQKRLDAILDIVGLSDRKKHTPRELSGGQQQRVAIARALINEPDIILADEPIGNLDTKTGIEIMELLRRINKEQGKNIIQVTHSNEAALYGDRVIHVRDGRIWE
jgi:putative ABC transport system ATP-binding protein